MASDKSTILDRLEAVIITRDTNDGSTLAASATAADATIDVDDDSDFADGDPIRIGEELNWVDGNPVSNTITLGRPLLRDYDEGVEVVKQVAYDLGPVLADGVTWSLQGTSVQIPVATDRLPIATLDGAKTQRIGWSSPSFTPHLFAFATGIDLSRVVGSGTESTPTVLTTAGGEFGEAANQVYIAKALTVGGDRIAVEAWNASTRVENLSANLSRGQQTPLPFAASTASFLFETADYEFTTSNIYAAQGGTVWNLLTEAGLFIKTATTTTLNGAVSAGAVSATLTSGASFDNDDWVLVEAGGGVEVTQLKNKSTHTFGLKIPAYRDWGNGVTVTKLAKVSFAAIAASGVTLTCNVASQDVNSALSSTVVHTRLGQADISLQMSPLNVTLENIAYATGVPISEIVSDTRVLADGTTVGTAVVPAAYCEGTTKSGAVTRVIAAGVNLDLANIASTWTNTGDGASLPMTWRPTSCISFLQYTPA